MSPSRTFLAALLIMAAAAAFAAPPKQMSVTVKETQVRATPSFLGKILATLAYGDRVDVLEQQSGWAKVSAPGKPQGWVNLSALTQKKIVLKAGAENVEQTASSGEVALAGKGFNKEVEAQYKQNSELDYTWVDRMEQFVMTPAQIIAFLQKGGLEGAAGGGL